MSTSPRVSVSEDSYLNPEPHDVIHTGLSAELSIYDTQNGGFYTIYLYFDTNIDLDLLLNMYEMDWCNANVPTLLNRLLLGVLIGSNPVPPTFYNFLFNL
jgi:hypothetical protein